MNADPMELNVLNSYHVSNCSEPYGDGAQEPVTCAPFAATGNWPVCLILNSNPIYFISTLFAKDGKPGLGRVMEAFCRAEAGCFQRGLDRIGSIAFHSVDHFFVLKGCLICTV